MFSDGIKGLLVNTSLADVSFHPLTLSLSGYRVYVYNKKMAINEWQLGPALFFFSDSDFFLIVLKRESIYDIAYIQLGV